PVAAVPANRVLLALRVRLEVEPSVDAELPRAGARLARVEAKHAQAAAGLEREALGGRVRDARGRVDERERRVLGLVRVRDVAGVEVARREQAERAARSERPGRLATLDGRV